MLRNLNNKKYRNVEKVSKQFNSEQNFSSSKVLSPSSLFLNPTIISKGKTASKSLVLKLRFKDGRIVVLKFNPNVNPSLNELFMYTHLNQLLTLDITPCVIQMIPLPNNIVLRSALHKSIGSYIKSSQSILIAKETYTKYTTLHDLEKPPIHFLFEVLYTLECFRRIGVCHNDLHHGNILAVFTKGRKTLYNQYTYTSQNKAKRIFYIPTSGYHPRIFDFDRGSCKNQSGIRSSFKVKSTFLKKQKKIFNEYFGYFYSFFNTQRDLTRFILPFLSSRHSLFTTGLQLFNLNHTDKYRKFFSQKIINKCDKSLLEYDYLVDKYTEKPIVLSKKELPTLDDMIMSHVFDEYTTLPKGCKVHARYFISHINK